jgi:hypothetical protein
MSISFDRSAIVSMVLVFYSSFTLGQISITSDDFSYAQDFNSLGSVGTDVAWVNGTTLDSWYATNASGYVVTYNAGSGTSSDAGIWSYGTTADRALGSIAQNASGDLAYGVLFENNSDVVINSIVLSLRAEQWRKVLTSTKGYQRVQVGYKIAENIVLTHTELLANSFTEVPEAYMISLDTATTASQAIDGNAIGNFATLRVEFPVSLGIGQQLFLRFYDSNIESVDVAMAVDDLEVTFSSTTINRVITSSDYNFSPYMDMGILEDIPPAGVGFSYIIPTTNGLDSLTAILQDFYSLDWNSLQANIGATNYDYQPVEFLDQINNRRYYVLRKNTLSSHFWGTYVLAENPSNPVLVIQSPHPLQDRYTEKQGATVFEFSGALGFMVAGISRCASDLETTCVPGSSDICGFSGPYRKSDVAHNSDCMFHLATTLLADSIASTVFVQLHGFGKDPGDPDFIVSSGTVNAMDKSVPDYGVALREEILNMNPSWQTKVVHADNYYELAATNNVQGRYLNNYPSDPCTGTVEPELVTNRFLHIEQYREVREYPTYYQPLANALSNVINGDAYTRHIPVTSVPFQYTQDFNSFATSSFALTWGNNLSKPGWYAANEDGLFSYHRFDDGSSSESGLYSFGNSVSDRSLGSLNNDDGDIMYGALFKNTSGSNINYISLEYDAKQWRRASNNTVSPQKVTFSYRVSTSINVSPRELLENNNFTNVASGDLITINNSAGNGALDGDITFTHITTSIPVLLPPNSEIFFRFYDTDEIGSDRAMALDNFNVTFSYDVVLPMDWVSVDVQRSEGFPLLKWVTTNEVNCDRYEVMKSANGHDFEKIATQKCLQNIDINEYHFLDTQRTMAHTLYYRIIQYDIDDQFSSSKTLFYSPIQSPEPNLWVENNALNISINGENELLEVAVFDMLGRNLYQGKPPAVSNTNYELELNGVLNQVLVVKCFFSNSIQTRKIIFIR